LQVAIAYLALAVFFLTPQSMQASAVRESVFKIQIVSQTAHDRQPWLTNATRQTSGSGFYIGDGRIMTNAHVVANAKFITVLKDGDAEAKPAYVEYIAHDSDLAVIKPFDPEYLRKVRPLRFGSVPKLRHQVTAIGYPTGGEQVSMTQGVVSRIDYRQYAHPAHQHHLLIQVDSAINPGNSGGPVVQGQRVIGVAFQGHTRAENTGYVIPVPVIERFLADIASGDYEGHPVMGMSVMQEAMANPATVRYHGLTKPVGVKVADVAAHSPFFGIFEAGDVLVNVAGHEIGVDGKILFHGERVSFFVVLDLRQRGDVVDFKFVRGKESRSVSVALESSASFYSADSAFALRPKYLVYAGLVFVGLSRNYLSSWGQNWFRDAPLHLRYRHYLGEYVFDGGERDEWIVYAGRLAAPVNTYLTAHEHAVLRSLDDVRVRSLAHLKELLSAADGELLHFAFEDQMPPIVMAREASQQSDAVISEHYGVQPTVWLQGREVDGAVTRGDAP